MELDCLNSVDTLTKAAWIRKALSGAKSLNSVLNDGQDSTISLRLTRLEHGTGYSATTYSRAARRGGSFMYYTSGSQQAPASASFGWLEDIPECII